jgi:PAS domain S-box-containing protein
LGTDRDITKRKQAVEALRESEEKYREIFEKSVLGLFKTTPDGSLIDVNDAFARIYDYSSAAEMLADSQVRRHFYISRYLYATPESRREIHHILAEKGKVENYETQYIKRDGTRLWVSISARTIRDADGIVLFFEGTTIDITDRKRAEEALMESEERFRTLFENVPVLIHGFDKSCRCVLWNKRCRSVFGWTIEEVNAQADPLSLFYPDPVVREDVRKTVTSAPEGNFREFHSVTRDGNELVIMWANFLITGGEVISIGYDITDLKRMDAEIKARAEEIAQISSSYKLTNSKLNFLTSITRHDIQNQLRGLMGYLVLAQRKAGDPQATYDLIRKAEKAGTIITYIIAFTKEYQKIGLKAPVWHDLRTLIQTGVRDTSSGKVVVENRVPPVLSLSSPTPSLLRSSIASSIMLSDTAARLQLRLSSLQVSGRRHLWLSAKMTVSVYISWRRNGSLSRGTGRTQASVSSLPARYSRSPGSR